MNKQFIFTLFNIAKLIHTIKAFTFPMKAINNLIR